MIPKIIHNIWIQGYKQMPYNLKKNIHKIKKLNSDWLFILWDEKKIINLLVKYPKIHKIYNNIEKLSGILLINAIKSDIARYLIMKEYGGVYFDLDFYCIHNFDNLFTSKKNTIYIASSKINFLDYFYPFNKPKYCSCFMAFEKNHPIWNNVLKIIILAKTKREIGEALDNSLKMNEKKYSINILHKINGPYSCESNNICYTPSKSSWNYIRPILQIINCNINKIILLIILIILFIYNLLVLLKY
jgi:hypothetical protein